MVATSEALIRRAESLRSEHGRSYAITYLPGEPPREPEAVETALGKLSQARRAHEEAMAPLLKIWSAARRYREHPRYDEYIAILLDLGRLPGTPIALNGLLVDCLPPSRILNPDETGSPSELVDFIKEVTSHGGRFPPEYKNLGMLQLPPHSRALHAELFGVISQWLGSYIPIIAITSASRDPLFDGRSYWESGNPDTCLDEISKGRTIESPDLRARAVELLNAIQRAARS